jgi:hypothetical protein
MRTHLRKTTTGENTWCGIRRNISKIMEGEVDNTSPFIKNVDCLRCLGLAFDWARQRFVERFGESPPFRGAACYLPKSE